MNSEKDRVSRAVSIAALTLSAFTLWHTSFRVINRLEARLVGGHVQKADSMARDSVVIEVAFVNSGNRDITIRQPYMHFSEHPQFERAPSIVVDKPLPLILAPQKFELLQVKFPVRAIPFKYAQRANMISEQTDLRIYRVPARMGYRAMDSRASTRESQQEHAFWLFLPDGFRPDSAFNWERAAHPAEFVVQFTKNELVTIFDD